MANQHQGSNFEIRHSIDLNASISSSSTTVSNVKQSKTQKGKEWLRRRSKKIFRKKTLYMRVPILKWLPQYTVQDLVADLIAGLTVGVTVIPQGLAYGTVAGLPPQYGLYAAYIGCFMYAFLGSTKAITIGPTALMALITYETSSVLGYQGAIVLTFFTGIIVLGLGLLNLGFLVDFISEPVVGGFTSAAAFSIATTQVENLLGLSFDADGFVPTWKAVFEHIEETRTWDAVMGFGSIACLLLLRIADQIKIGTPGQLNVWQRAFNETFRMISTARNAIVIVIGTVIAASLTTEDNKPFKVTGTIPAGLPPFQAPNFTIEYENTTYEFSEVASLIGSSIFVSPLVAILESVAIARSVAKGQRVDATQEMIAIGASNLLGSFVSSFPVTGSFSRTAVNSASGVRTALGGIYTGALVLLAITVLTPYFYYIPKSCLAAVIICAVIFMVEVRLVKHVWRSSKLDIIPLLVSFLFCLFLGLEQGIIIGAAVSLAILLYNTARPRISFQKQTMNGVDYLMVTPDRSIVFPAMDFFSSALRKGSIAYPGLPVVIDLTYVSLADFSTAYSFDHVTKSIKDRIGYPVIVTQVQPRVLKVLLGVKPSFVVNSDLSNLDHTIKSIVDTNDVDKSKETIVSVEG